jgi:hypothetical protein
MKLTRCGRPFSRGDDLGNAGSARNARNRRDPAFSLVRRRPSAAWCLALCLCVPSASWASGPLDAAWAALPDAPQPQPQPEGGLIITILDGEGALNNIRQRTAREPIVQVEDHNHKPVAGALVLFSINDGSTGAGATINGATTLRVTTDAAGHAQATGFAANGTAGSFTVTVTATLGALTSTVYIHQKNQSAPEQSSSQQSSTTSAGHSGIHIIPKSSLGKGLAAAGAAAGAAAVVVAVVILTKNNGATITAGTGSVTHP